MTKGWDQTQEISKGTRIVPRDRHISVGCSRKSAVEQTETCFKG